MQHYSNHCNAGNIFFSGPGLQCGNCLAIDFFDKLSEKQQKEYIKDIEKTHRIKLNPKTGKQIKK